MSERLGLSIILKQTYRRFTILEKFVLCTSAQTQIVYRTTRYRNITFKIWQVKWLTRPTEISDPQFLYILGDVWVTPRKNLFSFNFFFFLCFFLLNMLHLRLCVHHFRSPFISLFGFVPLKSVYVKQARSFFPFKTITDNYKVFLSYSYIKIRNNHVRKSDAIVLNFFRNGT